ncbi:PREDICTED: putative late blight resistance protein homolog R1B-14 isoform X2 [Ipomoea nil]|uniref:putative late blight resistance protein homolog R1B-14 isoform X2 n=1 Tax=Ipomoea nil TaxID=35883 RepID=UPI0009010FEE|nr:PREDICTED: putative late blight resistance protein homolog R1B-14 isoform X2 [Ipomoea nil]
MASVALTSLSATMKLEFQQPNNPRVSLDDEASISINSLFEKISSLQASVQEKSGGGPATRDLEMKIRDFALEAEDRIEIQLSNFLLAKNAEDQQKASQQLFQILQEAAENAAELLKLSSSISKEAVKNESEGPMIPWIKHSPVMLEGGTMVGRRRDHMQIVDKLVRDDDWAFEFKVITILGMTCIGKTTLATSVYNDPIVTSHFDVRGWVTMSGEYNKSQMLHDLLWTLTKETNIPDDDDVAARQVYNFLRGKRFLIVLDNLCNTQAWYDIRGCLPDKDDNGSRIVQTTMHLRRDYFYRNFGEEYCSLNVYVHPMPLLNSEESWDLFCNNPFLERHNMASKFEKIRSQVVEICEGLPHSIVVVAKRLSKCDNIQQEWKKVEKEIELIGVLDSRALTLTYHQLPQHLKVCFLYFGVFPKRSAIKMKLLIRLWIDEGFIEPLDNKGLENQAYEYLKEFIDRSLILIDNWSFDEKIKNGRIHSAFHSFCVREAQKEGILCSLNTRQLPQESFSMFANSCRWLSLYTHKFDYYVLLKTNNPRSIFFFQEDAEIFVSFKLLRVLAFVPSSFLQRVQTRLQDLVFLRYLSVSEWFEGLEYVVSTNRNLQTLVVSSNESKLGAPPPLHLPSTIWGSSQLQHLELDKSYVIDPPSMDKDNMQTLSWVCPTHCRTGLYCRFPNIKILKIFVSDSSPIIFDNLECLKRLERLTISVSLGHVVTLPKPSVFPSQLKKLRLNGINLSERDLTAIGILPQLKVLKLKNVFHGKVWEVEESGFHNLKFLLLEDKTLKQWRADKYSFCYLERLVLRFCYDLKKIPYIMEYSRYLKSIELQQCCPSVITSAEDIQRSKRATSRYEINFEIKIR